MEHFGIFNESRNKIRKLNSDRQEPYDSSEVKTREIALEQTEKLSKIREKKVKSK